MILLIHKLKTFNLIDLLYFINIMKIINSDIKNILSK